MEHPNPNKQSESAADAMNRLHNLASEHPDPEKDEIAKKLLEQWEKAQEEGNSDEVIRLIGEIEKLYDGTPGKEETKKKKKETPEGKVTFFSQSGGMAASLPEQNPNPNASRELKENGAVIVGPLKGTFISEKFFNDKNKNVKICIEGDFENSVLKSAGSVSEQPPTAIISFTLAKAIDDSKIRSNLPKNHVFDIGDLWMIADLIKKQPNGESGDLLADGNANLFYVQVGASVPVVCVYMDGSVWHILAWVLGCDARWDDGSRVFSRHG
jgi:hypothetical protein